ANQAGASVTVQMGETVVLAAVSMATRARPGMDFFPLMVDYEEKYFAAGKIKGPRFLKREGRPSNQAVLTSRMIDRGLRPLFPQLMRNDIQVICMPLCLDYANKPDIVAMIAACTALHISNIPFDGPIGGVRVGLVNGEYVINPTVDELEYSELSMVLMGDGERITNVDCHANELTDEQITSALMTGMDVLGPIAKFIDDIRKEVGKEKAGPDELIMKEGTHESDAALIEQLKTASLPHLAKYLFNTPKGTKGERKDILKGLKQILIDEFKTKLVTPERDVEEAEKYLTGLLKAFFFSFIEEQVTNAILDKEMRVDGRKLDEIRELKADVGLLPRTHGTGLFSRGETQVLSIVTLGSPGDDLSIESMEMDGTMKYFHHYNFPPFSVGEVKPLRGASRRDIGHGALAEKGLLPMIPPSEEFPYTVRVVSEVMSSNGSSSMGATCGSTLALLDAGVPIKKPVAGIAMGMACNADQSKWKVLTDLQDLEDGDGGMDFKFTGTRDGLTAVQMDTKTRGLSRDMVKATMPQMRKALGEILDVIDAAIPKPREDLSPYAPRITSFMIDPEKIREVIGPGGKVIRALTEEYDVQIDLEDDGTVLITSDDAERAGLAQDAIKDIIREPEVGDVFEEAVVVKIMNFGAFVNLFGNTDGLLHVSEIAWERTENVSDKLKEGDKVKVRIIKIERGKVEVSMKSLLPMPEGYVEPPKRERRPSSRDGRDRRGGRDSRDRRPRRDNDRR
ncbi:MAG: polyribonucleotide nucleotidyltransferase, partial [Thermoplasmata archaeon]|nr:polyribonucleotide nucleotidyltransferase [Thermoplasmata archaeon]